MIGKVIARWWLQFDAIVWPDKLAMDLAAFLPESGKPKLVFYFDDRSASRSPDDLDLDLILEICGMWPQI